ncbi:MAG: magnesium chelatase subunit D [Alkalilacustris sp.]
MIPADGPPAVQWARLGGALALLAIDPGGLGGLWLRARSGPVREAAVAALPVLPLPLRRLHCGIGDEQLFGGVDLASTLAEGRVVHRAGLLADAATLVLPMAERCPTGLAARLAGALDSQRHALIALDEGAAADESLPSSLTDRLAFHLDLGDLRWRECPALLFDADDLAEARARLPFVRLPDHAAEDLVSVALRLGIDSLRAPMLAARAARAEAALAERDVASVEDLTRAVELVLVPRATQMPAEEAEDTPPPEQEPEAPEPPPESEHDGDSDDGPAEIPQEVLLEAAKALLPPDLLERMGAMKAARTASGSGAGAARKGNRRGKPLPSRPGRPSGEARVDLVATLRNAAPWQPLRRAQAAQPDRPLHIRMGDIRLRRFEEKSDRLLIFAVDASGSAAFARLAEAKGAVEILLAEAYARRDHVALVAFRGAEAELLLPPTRSLVQTKRRLAALPGGGGTPLAAGLRAALQVALQARGRGMTPTVALLTDGRANIALDGAPNRAQAAEDASAMARALRAQGVPAIVIDMGARPEAALRRLAAEMAGPYLALPRADAGRLSAAVAASLEG